MASNKYREEVVPLAARTANGNTNPFDLSRADQLRAYINVTAGSGTIATFDVKLQDTPNGSDWYDLATQSIAAAVPALYVVNIVVPFSDLGRVAWVVTGGTTPSRTFTVDLLRVEFS